MTISHDEAADTLRDIAAVHARSQLIYGYREASPHLFLWGALWAAGYGLTATMPSRGGLIWIAVITIGLIAGFLIGLRTARRHDAQADPARRLAIGRLRRIFNGTSLTAAAFITASLVVMSPVNPHQIGAFVALVVGASYALLGLWAGARFIAIGAAVAALTLGGFLMLPAHFEAWMAAVGGSALLVGGLWLRRA